MRTVVTPRRVFGPALFALLVAGIPLPGGPSRASAQTAVAQAPPPVSTDVRRLTVDDAVRLAIENNLGIQIARIDPQIQDLGIAQAMAGWTPSFTSTVQQASSDTPSTSFLSGGQAKTSDGRLGSTVGITQALRSGGSYTVGWDTTRSTTDNLFSNFSPQIRSSLSFHVQQPLVRNRTIDATRQQVLVGRKNREVSEIGLRQTMASTTRTVKNAYWELAYAIASLQVQQQSLQLAQESLRNTRARVDIGTIPPIDIIEAESEVATRQEAVILAEAQIETAEDTLRQLIYDPSMPGFWTLRIEPTELPAFAPTPVDLDGAIGNALVRRTDLRQSRTTLEASDISIRYARDQTLPDVTASLDYGLTGLGGTQFIRGAGFPGPIVGQSSRGFGSVLSNLFTKDYPSWTLTVNVSYPLGTSTQEAGLARARLQYTQSQAQIRNQELQVAAQVRTTARQVLTNQQRVQTTRVSRELAERRLDAEQKKLAAGTSTSFVVFQTQRDLALARNNELRAVLDYNKSIVDLEAIQDTPIAGSTGSVTQVTATTGTAAASTAAGSTNNTTGSTNQRQGF